jgi:hypothetical protein
VRRAALLALLVLVTGATARADIADDVHLGVASCATGVCHGKLSEQADQNVWLNEYRIWSADDRHARAYLTLGSPESKAMAAKLGLASAQTAKICLDCHADNVPAAKRGPKFQISDGVGCEACHGGAERWIETHTEPGVEHADNLAKGMYRTENPLDRAAVCLDCHMGDADRYATHVIMGAGHPRLSFELDAFTTNQPAHFEIDDDYVRRKGPHGGATDGFGRWLAGQVAGARRMLALQASDWLSKPEGIFPELALYDCQSCHHAMDDRRWTQARVGAGIRPGTLRLNDDHLRILVAATAVLDSGERAGLEKSIDALVRAGQRSPAAVAEAARALDGWLAAREKAWSDRTFERGTVVAVRKAVVAAAANGDLSDYGAAEQTFLAVDSLGYALGDGDRLSGRVDTLFKTVENDQTYRPDHFEAAARALLDAL